MMHPPTQALILGRKPPGPDWGGNQRHFESLRQAIEFVMQGLTIADRANVWIATEDGNLMIEQIEQLQ